MDAQALAEDQVAETLGVLLKYQDDIARMRAADIGAMVGRARDPETDPAPSPAGP